MRQAMAEAEVGDDWYGDDPTVNRLQDRAAELTGSEAALYLPTGTMCTQSRCTPSPGPALVVCEAAAHVGGTEASSSAVLSGIAFQRLPGAARGLLTAEQVAAALEPDPYDVDVVDLVCLENTHQVGGGTAMPVEDVRAIHKVCADRGVPLYLDGARVFNACAVDRRRRRRLRGEVEAMMFCLSKGLGAPIGSMLVGDARVHPRGPPAEDPVRRGLAAGRRHGRGRPDRAGRGPEAAARGPRERPAAGRGRRRDRARHVSTPPAVETNILFVDVTRPGHDVLESRERLAAEGVLVTMVAGRVRMLTHVDIADADSTRARRVAPGAAELGA